MKHELRIIRKHEWDRRVLIVYECRCGFKFIHPSVLEQHIKGTTEVETEQTTKRSIAERIEARIRAVTWLEYKDNVDLRLYKAMIRGAEIALEEYHKEDRT
jgi:hypothetical protein